MGLARGEEEACRTAGVLASTEGAVVDEKGNVDVTSPPPDELDDDGSPSPDELDPPKVPRKNDEESFGDAAQR
jgi:hypothetical protein